MPDGAPDLVVGESRVIAATASQIYGVLADYQADRARILPASHFRNLQVEQGGVGSGTIVRFETRLVGAWNASRVFVTEPQPGRVLVETDPEAGTSSTFSLRPLDTGDRTLVRIETVTPMRPGVLGLVERAALSALLRQIQSNQLELIAAAVASPA